MQSTVFNFIISVKIKWKENRKSNTESQENTEDMDPTCYAGEQQAE
jgi:hypothetical protein